MCHGQLLTTGAREASDAGSFPRFRSGYSLLVQDAFDMCDGEGQLVSTAVHAGHELRPGVDARILIDDDTRPREEDPFTDHLL